MIIFFYGFSPVVTTKTGSELIRWSPSENCINLPIIIS